MSYYVYDSRSGFSGPKLLTKTLDGPDDPGVYLLANRFYYRGRACYSVEYVGRADTSLPRRIRWWAGRGYAYVFYLYTDSPFEVECEEFHFYGGDQVLDNDIHPARPKGSKGAACSRRGCRG